MEKLTKEQAAVIGAYTGVACGPFSDVQDYAAQLLGRQLFTHDFAKQELVEELKRKSKGDFISICADHS